MSRLGKKQITIPQGTTVAVKNRTVIVSGAGGELNRVLHPHVDVEIKDGFVIVSLNSKSRKSVPLWGTYASHIKNMISGVNTPFTKKLIIEGIGYKVALKGSEMIFSIGFSHDVNLTIPKDIKVVLEKENINITGIDKDMVGEFAANVRKMKPPEPYKGKGIRYFDEIIRRKEGKRAAATSA